MLKRLHYISVQLPALLLALACGLVTCGCSSDTDEPQPGPDPAREVVGTLGFYINMGDTFCSSRAGTSRTPTDGPYDPGSGYENYIDFNGGDVHLYAFTGNNPENTGKENVLYQEITGITVIPVEPYESDPTFIKRYYYVTFPVTREFKEYFEKNSLKLVMLANWGTYPEVAARPDASGSSTAAETDALQPDAATIADLVTKSDAAVMDYKYDSAVTPSTLGTGEGKHLIPLFGVNDFGTVTDLVSGSAKWLGTLNLLRAFAKVEVYDAPDSPVHIKAAYITRHKTKLYKAPKNVFDEGDYVKGSYAPDYGNAPSVPADPEDPTYDGSNDFESIDKIYMEKIAISSDSEDGNDDGANNSDSRHRFLVYVPEYRNVLLNGTQRPDYARMRIGLEYDEEELDENGKQKQYYIDIAEYKFSNATQKSEVDKYLNVCRNYWYKFEIKKTTRVMNVVADIQPYAEVNLTPPFGLDRDKEGNIIIRHHEDGTYDIIEDGKTVTKDKDGDVVIKVFSDGTLLCRETVYKDYIHDDSEVDYVYPFEKDYSGGNMIIIRQISSGGTFHGDIDETHDHGVDDRPMFVLDKKGEFYYVTYDSEGTPTLSPNDSKGDKIVQVNGFQFRNKDDMIKYIGSYVVELEDGTQELRYYKDGSVLDWDEGVPESMK